jgi:hypothetical protein
MEDGSLGETYQMRGGIENCIQEFSLRSEGNIYWIFRRQTYDITKIYLKAEVGYVPVDCLPMAEHMSLPLCTLHTAMNIRL